jgi:hypothetical protein
LPLQLATPPFSLIFAAAIADFIRDAAISLPIAAAVRHAATIFAADFWFSPFSEFAAFDDFACPADDRFLIIAAITLLPCHYAFMPRHTLRHAAFAPYFRISIAINIFSLIFRQLSI